MILPDPPWKKKEKMAGKMLQLPDAAARAPGWSCSWQLMYWGVILPVTPSLLPPAAPSSNSLHLVPHSVYEKRKMKTSTVSFVLLLCCILEEIKTKLTLAVLYGLATDS